MGNLVHQPCPYEECGSSDAFSWEQDDQVGHCHSCSRSYPMTGMNQLKIFDWVASDYPLKQRKENVMQREIDAASIRLIEYIYEQKSLSTITIALDDYK